MTIESRLDNKSINYSEPVIYFTIGDIRDAFNNYFEGGVLGENPWENITPERRDDILDAFQHCCDLSEQWTVACEYVFEDLN